MRAVRLPKAGGESQVAPEASNIKSGIDNRSSGHHSMFEKPESLIVPRIASL